MWSSKETAGYHEAALKITKKKKEEKLKIERTELDKKEG